MNVLIKLPSNLMLQISDLRRDFINEPISISAEIGSEARFSCTPPEGFPKPSIYWLKNGKLIRDAQISHAINQLHRNDKQKKSDRPNSVEEHSNQHEGEEEEEEEGEDYAENDSISMTNEDSNYLLQRDGSLVIKKVRPSDHANYTCAAANRAGVRHSLPAILTVYGKIQSSLLTLSLSAP